MGWHYKKMRIANLTGRNCQNRQTETCKRHRLPPISFPMRSGLYYRLNHRDIQGLLADHGIIISREASRLWCIKFNALCVLKME
jgi:putative transposase